MKTARFCNNDEKATLPLLKKTDLERKRGKFPPFLTFLYSFVLLTSDELRCVVSCQQSPELSTH